MRLYTACKIARTVQNGWREMDYTFVSMTREYALRITENWKYEAEYSIYDYANEADHMLDPGAWGSGIFAILSPEGELVGELSIEFFTSDDEATDYADFGNRDLINQRELWIGFGMRPDLVGKGRGAGFVNACAEYAVKRTGYAGEHVFLGVARFNRRAIRAYEVAGFEVFKHTSGTINGETFKTVHMRKKLRFEDTP
jgi:[ribosomal protein S18]-alanine N-acetyltransferase